MFSKRVDGRRKGVHGADSAPPPSLVLWASERELRVKPLHGLWWGRSGLLPAVRREVTGWCQCGSLEISLSLWRLHDSKHLNLTYRFSCKGACHYSPKYLRKFLVSHLENGFLLALCVRWSEAVPKSQLASHGTFPVAPRPTPLWPEEEPPGPPWRSHGRLQPWT